MPLALGVIGGFSYLATRVSNLELGIESYLLSESPPSVSCIVP